MDTNKSFKAVKKEINFYDKQVKDNVNFVLRLSYESARKATKGLVAFLNKECCNYSANKRKVFKEHDIDNTLKFNFFESISDLYYRENFHSDILEVLLNPNTKEIGRKWFMQEFVNFLGLTPEQFDCRSDFYVIREKGKIDLLIKNETQAVIIENKINYAPDMDNQLVRYMQYVDEGLDIKTYTVVYLTLIDDENKKPPLDSYDKCFEKYSNQLKFDGILKEVYAIADEGKKSLENCFLPNCQNRLKEEAENTESEDIKQACNTAQVYIEQYKILLNHLGGIEYMKSVDKNIIKEIYSSQDKFDAANDFVGIWENRAEVLHEILKDSFIEHFPDRELQKKTVHGYDLDCWESKNHDFYIYYWYKSYQIGYCPLENNKFSPEQKETLEAVIRKIPNKETSFADETWINCDIQENRNVIDNIIKGLEILFEN